MKIIIQETTPTVLFDEPVNYIVQVTDAIPLQFDGARVDLGTVQSIPNGAWTPVSFNYERFDTADYFSVVTPTYLIVPRTGRYLIGGTVGFASNATGIRGALLAGDIGGSADLRSAVNGSLSNMSLSDMHWFTIGAHISMQVYQNSGGALNLVANANSLWIIYLGP